MKTYPFEFFEPEIDEEFMFSDSNDVYKCVVAPENYDYDSCYRCAFNDSTGYYHENPNPYCQHMKCIGRCDFGPRKDKTNVYFVRVK